MEHRLIYLCLCWLSTQAVYVSRMGPNPNMRVPMAFRPGVNIRPWMNQRIMTTATRRAPYVLYRTPMHRYMKPYPSNTPVVRHMYNVGGTWKTTSRLPFASATPKYDFITPAASLPLKSQSDGGAIRTIPAPNLSLSEKPIVVMDGSQNLITPFAVTTETPKAKSTSYQVTEKFVEPFRFGDKNMQSTPVGFSKPGVQSADLSTLMRNNMALQLASEYGLSAVALPPSSPGLPQQIQVQGIQIPNSQDISQPGYDSIFIPPSAIFQPDQAFLQKLQNQLLERFPAVEFVPYPAQNLPHSTQNLPHSTQNLPYSTQNFQHSIQSLPYSTQNLQFTSQSLPHPQPLVNFQVSPTISTAAPTQAVTNPVQNLVTHQQLSVVPISNEQHKTVVREAQESFVTLLPQIAPENVTENQVEINTASQARNLTMPLPLLVDVTPALSTSTVRFVESSTESNTSPIYYAQIGQSVGNLVANGFFSAINDVRAAATLAQEDKQNAILPETTTEKVTTTTISTTTTTMDPDLQNYFIKSVEKDENNQTIAEVKPLLGVPFTKPEANTVEYSVVRSSDKNQVVNKDGSVYAGQIVKSTISEDKDYQKYKTDIYSRRPPLRIVKDNDNKITTPATKLTVVKAKIPPRSKLTFDEKTGEPVLRIYASYVDTPLHKEMIASKIANIKHVKEVVTRNQDVKSDSYRSSARTQSKLAASSDTDQVAEFGLKLRSRLDDIIPIFDGSDD